MNKFACFIIGVLLLALGALPFMANAQSAATWIPTTSYLKPYKSTLGLRVPALASANNCLITDADGDFSTTACSAGGAGTVTSVAMTVPTGLTIAGSPITTTGTLALSLTAGYNIPLTASTTAWNNFLVAPSSVIIAGDGLTWSTNTLNFDGGNTPAGDLGGTWASPSVTDDSHAHTGSTLSGIDISSDTNLAGDAEIVLTGDTLSIASSIARDSELHSAITLAGALDYITLAGQVITRGAIDLATDITGVLGIANGGLGAAFTDPNADQLMFWDDSAAKITGIATLSGAAISGTTLTINDVTCTDCLSSTEITGIVTGDITDNTILEGDLDLDDSPADGDILTYDTTGTNFVWETILALVNSITGAVDWGGITSLEIPNGASPTVDALGEIAVDSTSDQLIFFGSAKRVVSGYQYPSFSYSTSSWTGTTTLELGPAIVGEDWSRLSCYTDAGTLKVSIYDGTNRMNLVNASSTVASFALSTNNTFTAGEKRTVQIGSPATSPKRIGCTVQKAITAN